MRYPILLVDDNPHDAELTLAALSPKADEEVKVVASGQEALDYLRRAERAPAPELPDLILLDLNMPQMDGLAVLDAIRADEGTRDIPVVMLTTSGEERDIRESYARGASGYVVKPMELPQFFETMAGIRHFWMKLNRRPQLG